MFADTSHVNRRRRQVLHWIWDTDRKSRTTMRSLRVRNTISHCADRPSFAPAESHSMGQVCPTAQIHGSRCLMGWTSGCSLARTQTNGSLDHGAACTVSSMRPIPVRVTRTRIQSRIQTKGLRSESPGVRQSRDVLRILFLPAML